MPEWLTIRLPKFISIRGYLTIEDAQEAMLFNARWVAKKHMKYYETGGKITAAEYRRADWILSATDAEILAECEIGG